MLWEVSSGRFISTGQAHLQKVTAVAWDKGDDFILTGGGDANVLVWSLQALVDVRGGVSERKPERSLSQHQREVTGVVCGSAGGPAGIAVSSSMDLSCIVRLPP